MAAVSLTGISKRYNIYERPVDRLKEMLWRNKRSFHREFWAVRNVDLQCQAGKTTALIGPNGSGKSTLLQIMAGVITPTTGQVNITGRVTAILELGAGFQPEYTGRENVMLNGMILGISREEMLKRLDTIAEFADIGDFFDQPVKSYSSGMVVRLAFAVATTVDPDVLLVDEALAVGDMSFQVKCFKKCLSLQEAGKTIVLVTHDMETVSKHCDHVILLNGGQVLVQGRPELVVPQYEQLMNAGAAAPKVITAAPAAV